MQLCRFAVLLALFSSEKKNKIKVNVLCSRDTQQLLKTMFLIVTENLTFVRNCFLLTPCLLMVPFVLSISYSCIYVLTSRLKQDGVNKNLLGGHSPSKILYVLFALF